MLDRYAFDEFAGLLDDAELREVIAEWQSDAQTSLSQISGALTRGDAVEIGRLAHRAAGGSLALGALGLAALWEQLRWAAEAGGGVDVVDLDRVSAAIEATQRALHAAAGFT
jgi:HPt (histidine-containing phosphotransfer) domain-containing protein